MEHRIKNNPLLSIVIPTRNRQQYAVSAVKSILSIPSDEIELVLQDSSDSMELRSFVSCLRDSRLRYNYTTPPVSGVENFNIAASLATGEYVCFIGDDDGVNPEIVEAALWAKKNNIDALTPSRVVNYFWPDLRQKYYGAKYAGRLAIRPFTGTICKKDVKTGLIKCLKKACQNLVDAVDLPKIYYGIVKKSCMDKVFDKTGSYFPGVSPDMSGAIAVACCVSHVWTIDYPLFVPGSSAVSTAGDSAKKMHVGRLQDQPNLPIGCWNDWPDIVPSFYAVQTVWAQSGVRSLVAMGRADILGEFNIPLLHAMCAVFNPQYFLFTIRSFDKALKVTKGNRLKGLLSFIYAYLFTWGLRVRSLINRFIQTPTRSDVYNIESLNDIQEAVDALKEHLRGARRSFYETCINTLFAMKK